jgi:hypothetical protein
VALPSSTTGPSQILARDACYGGKIVVPDLLTDDACGSYDEAVCQREPGSGQAPQ